MRTRYWTRVTAVRTVKTGLGASSCATTLLAAMARMVESATLRIMIRRTEDGEKQMCCW